MGELTPAQEQAEYRQFLKDHPDKFPIRKWSKEDGQKFHDLVIAHCTGKLDAEGLKELDRMQEIRRLPRSFKNQQDAIRDHLFFERQSKQHNELIGRVKDVTDMCGRIHALEKSLRGAIKKLQQHDEDTARFETVLNDKKWTDDAG